MQLAPDRAVETGSAGAIRIGATTVTGAGGWMRLSTQEPSVPVTLRAIEVHLVLERADVPGGMTNVWADAIRFAGIEWRRVREFLDATDHAWAPILGREIERAIRRSTQSGVYRR